MNELVGGGVEIGEVGVELAFIAANRAFLSSLICATLLLPEVALAANGVFAFATAAALGVPQSLSACSDSKPQSSKEAACCVGREGGFEATLLGIFLLMGADEGSGRSKSSIPVSTPQLSSAGGKSCSITPVSNFLL